MKDCEMRNIGPKMFIDTNFLGFLCWIELTLLFHVFSCQHLCGGESKFIRVVPSIRGLAIAVTIAAATTAEIVAV